MTTVALREALSIHDALMNAECKGRKDKESAIRSRLSDNTGVPESYLFRLMHKRRDMRDVQGEMYRLLKLAADKYGVICERIEATADRLEARRLNAQGQENAVSQGRGTAGERTMAGDHAGSQEG